MKKTLTKKAHSILSDSNLLEIITSEAEYWQKAWIHEGYDSPKSKYIYQHSKSIAPELIKLMILANPKQEELFKTYGERILQVWLGDYVVNAAQKQRPSREILHESINKLIQEAVTDEIHIRDALPIAGIKVHKKIFFKANKRSSATFKKLSPLDDPRKYMFDYKPNPYRTFRPWEFGSGLYDTILIVDRTIDKTMENYPGGIPKESRTFINDLLTALRLFGISHISTNRVYSSRDTLYSYGESVGSSFSHAPFAAGIYSLTEKRIKKFQKFWQELESLFPLEKNLPERISQAIQHLNTSHSKSRKDKFFEQFIALELLANATSENRYRVPIKIATLFNDKEIYTSTKALIDTRNRIAHGCSNQASSQKLQDEVSKKLPILSNILNKSLLAHISLFLQVKRDKVRYQEITKETEFEKEFLFGSLKIQDSLFHISDIQRKLPKEKA